MTTIDPARLSDIDLLNSTTRAARDERGATAELLALLAEVDARRLYLGEGLSSLFAYCTQVLHLSEHAAYHRIEAARAARQHPVILERVASGDLTLTAVAMLRPHLTPENHKMLLDAARHKSKRDVEYQLACLAPKAAAKALIRRMPDAQVRKDVLTSGDGGAAVGAESAAPSSFDTSVAPSCDARYLSRSPAPASTRPVVTPLASDRFLLRVTLSADAYATLRRAQDLMRHTIPDGDPGAILAKALTLLVDQLEKVKTAKTARPRRTSSEGGHAGGSRHVPAQVKRTVWTRDQGRCAFVGPHGRCTETAWLEYHHVIPFARGGPTSVSNIALRCRAHNGLESELMFGRWSRPTEERTRSGPS
jgi:5-methylcytosine-specific restriction endonuclease McrA